METTKDNLYSIIYIDTESTKNTFEMRTEKWNSMGKNVNGLCFWRLCMLFKSISNLLFHDH